MREDYYNALECYRSQTEEQHKREEHDEEIKEDE